MKLSVGNKILMLGLAILVVLNIANFLFLGEFFEHEEDPVLIKKDRGEFWFDFWEEWLEDEGILNDGFLDYLARGRLEISRAEDEKEIQEILHSFTIVIKERINSQMENKQIINLKNSLAENLEFHSREGCFILLPNGNSMEVFEIKGDFSLKPDFHEKIKGFSFTRPVQISWEDENLTVDQQEFLKDFLEKKEKELEIKEDEWEKLARKAGYADLKGEGVIVKVFDLRGGYRNEDIVHDTDIRRIVNELFAAGAEGVQVGPERLVATSAIRCAGPTILVNQNPIPVDPVVIKAIGDPETLGSSLSIVKNELQVFGVDVEIEQKENIVLEKYDR